MLYPVLLLWRLLLHTRWFLVDLLFLKEQHRLYLLLHLNGGFFIFNFRILLVILVGIKVMILFEILNRD